ncbi:MAG: hypothetical protein GKR91_09195 [Pseudomonadales bacterium]|nr:hypothetical protein [Pseudomonadales bacterium]
MRRIVTCLLLIPLSTISFQSSAQVNFSGYLKNYTIAQDEIDNGPVQLDRTFRMQNSGRFMLDAFNDNQVWQIHYEAGVDSTTELQNFGQSLFTPERNSYRLTDLQPTIGSDQRKNVLPQNLDRLNVQLQFDSGDLTIGRQAITFGSARIINPTDVFLPFDVRTLNTEYRVGVDAVRFQKPLGQLGEVDVGVILGEDGKAENSAGFLQVLTNAAGNDYQFTAMRFADQNLLGVGIQSALGELGFWLEAAHVSGDDDYTRASIGLDYAFNERVFGMVEYHFNEAGAKDPEDYFELFDDKAYTAGGVFLLGQNYLIPAVTWQASTLLGLSFQSLINLDDQSVFFSVNGDYSLSDNLYMGMGYYHFAGDDLDFFANLPPQQQLQLGSEYGSNPDSLYISIRYYF